MVLSDSTIGNGLHKELKKEVQDKIDSDFDESSGNTFTAAMIIIHREADCCGMEGVADFGSKTHHSCDTANEQTGCYDEMQDVIQDNKLYAGLVGAALLALQVIEVICAIVIYKDSSLKINPF
ncbi:leukocyte surface antigen cd53 [Plakobranchus ocellatus]|uniref:Leukocyte surface antigen cd53 n=1 Tax=Plakobranchus ocellatus TaxID=259542 RepID=A0AAV4CWU7_9GAST|nr:leukocyte surface antigen cd53 [Plakobranchus ocellatus]